ncbi:hypothetical protein [Streptomyces nodosus]|uniref:hypothetical protein n=2 Tax=Streptomyces nodosus TaxID=40318 RepID=UPI00380AF3F7
MQGHTMKSAVTLCAATAFAAVMATASAAPAASPPSTAQRPVLVDCTWQPQEHPTDFMIACGDGNSRLSSLHWSVWGPESAVATGINTVNDCKPYCAAGRFHDYPVVVRLDNPRPWKGHSPLRQYTVMNLIYTHDSPEGSGRTVSYPLWS